MAVDLDLTSNDGVTKYLQSTSFAPKQIERLSGGSGNYTWRVELEKPHQGHHSVVFKHAEAHVAQMPTMPFSTDRFVRILSAFC